MPSITSIQAAVSTIIDTLNAVRTEAQMALAPAELESAEATLADARVMEDEMGRSAATIIATLQEIQGALAARTATVRDTLKTEALERLAALVESGALSLEDVVSRLGVALPAVAPAPAPATKPQAVASTGGKYMNPDKYRNPNTGETWSGRGPAPKWLKALAVDGKTFEDFRIEAPANAPAQAPAAEAPAPAAQAAEAPSAPAASSDIGGTMSFDGNLDDDIGADIGGEGLPTGTDPDIGDMLPGLQAAGTAIQDGVNA